MFHPTSNEFSAINKIAVAKINSIVFIILSPFIIDLCKTVDLNFLAQNPVTTIPPLVVLNEIVPRPSPHVPVSDLDVSTRFWSKRLETMMVPVAVVASNSADVFWGMSSSNIPFVSCISMVPSSGNVTSPSMLPLIKLICFRYRIFDKCDI